MRSLLLLAALGPLTLAEPPKAKITIGKETTVVDGPLDSDGYIDYTAALNARLGKGVTPKTNAKVLLVQAFGPKNLKGDWAAEYYKALGIEPLQNDGDYFINWSAEYAKNTLKLEGDAFIKVNEQFEQAMTKPWAAADYPCIATWLTDNEKPLAIILEATRRPEYYTPIILTKSERGPGAIVGRILPETIKARSVTAALKVRALLKLKAGDWDGAWIDAIAIHRLGLLVSRGATAIEGLVGLALEGVALEVERMILNETTWDAQQLQTRLKELEKLPPRYSMIAKLAIGERFIALDAVQDMCRRPDEAAGKGMDCSAMMKTCNTWFDRMAKAGEMPTRMQRIATMRTIEAELKEKTKANAALEAPPSSEVVSSRVADSLMSLMLPSVEKLQAAEDRVNQTAELLRIAFALTAERQANGSYPAKLEDLVPKYFIKVPGDRYSIKPLIYKLEKDGFLLYSVFENGKDENGHGRDDTPKGDDIRIRMQAKGK